MNRLAKVNSTELHARKDPESLHAELASLYKKFRSLFSRQQLFSSFRTELEQILGARKALFFLVRKDANHAYYFREYPASPTKGNQARSVERPFPGSFPYSLSDKILPLRGENRAAFSRVLAMLGHRLDKNDSGHILILEASPSLWGVMVFVNASALHPDHNALTSSLEKIIRLARRLLREMTAELRHQQEVLERDILLQLAQKISSSLRLERVLDTIIDALRAVVPYDSAAIFVLNRRTGEIEYEVARGYRNMEARQKLRLKIGQGVSGWVAKTGQPILVPDVRREKRYIAVDTRTRSEVAVPIKTGSKIVGVLNLESHHENAFTPHQTRLLEAFAGPAAIAIQNAKLYRLALEKRELEKDLKLAHDIQRALLPHALPNSRRLRLAAYNKASRQIGGDLYDALRLADGKVAVAVADVSGKGIAGALMMATLHTIYRGELRKGLQASRLMERVNREFAEKMTSGNFATFFHALLDSKNNQLEYCSAGHNPALLIRPDGSYMLLESTGVIIGFLKGAKFDARTIPWRPGDLLVAYSDGITESENRQGDLFGQERLIKLVLGLRDASPDRIKMEILRAVEKFQASAYTQDDITLIIAKYMQDVPRNAD